MYPSRASILMSGLAASNSASSARNFLRSTASVSGGNPLTVIVTGPPAADPESCEHPDTADSPSTPTASTPTARPNLDRFIRQHLPWSGVDNFVIQTIQSWTYGCKKSTQVRNK